MSNLEAPISRWRELIIPEWTDYNGHMNVAYFTLIFDHATEVFYPLVGLGQPYRQRTGKSTFAVECHISYLREANIDDEVEVTTQLLGFDDKRLHYFHVMTNAQKGFQMATLEQLSVHVDLNIRKVEPFADDTREKLTAMMAAHKHLPPPKQIGSVMALGSKRSK